MAEVELLRIGVIFVVVFVLSLSPLLYRDVDSNKDVRPSAMNGKGSFEREGGVVGAQRKSVVLFDVDVLIKTGGECLIAFSFSLALLSESGLVVCVSVARTLVGPSEIVSIYINK